MDATSCVVADTNKVNSIADKSVLFQLSRLINFGIPLHFLSQTVKLDATTTSQSTNKMNREFLLDIVV